MTFTAPGWLVICYLLNILILIPVCLEMFRGRGTQTVFSGAAAPSEALERLVASLWLAILLASVGGLFLPAFFAPVILVQVVYKSVWLAGFVAPHRRDRAVPSGIAGTFAFIVLAYPVLFLLALFGGPEA